jgi:hypothetical protein
VLQGLTYDRAQATVNGTVTLRLPGWLEVLLHHANLHLPEHLSLSIPSYRLPAAQAYLDARLGQYLTYAAPNTLLLRNLLTAWLIYDEQRGTYVDLDAGEELLRAGRQDAPNGRGELQQQQPVRGEEDGNGVHSAAYASV